MTNQHALSPSIQNRLAFHNLLFAEVAEVKGVVGELAETLAEIVGSLARTEQVAVIKMHFADVPALCYLPVIVDARLQEQRASSNFRDVTQSTVCIGPVRGKYDIAVKAGPNAKSSQTNTRYMDAGPASSAA